MRFVVLIVLYLFLQAILGFRLKEDTKTLDEKERDVLNECISLTQRYSTPVKMKEPGFYSKVLELIDSNNP